MLKRCGALLGRPKGPLGQRPGGGHMLTVPYRSEVTMISLLGVPIPNGNIRELFKKPLERSHLYAIPRDLGEVPRSYVLKALFLHQPARLLDLWEVLKQRDDVPLDSAKHLRLVLKVAKMQRWAYAEKNQTDNQYYYYIERARMHEVQAMVRADEVARREEESAERNALVVSEEQERVDDAQSLDDRIAALQALLVSNISQISNFDPQYVQGKPYVTESGAVNCAWHWSGAGAAADGDDSAGQEKET